VGAGNPPADAAVMKAAEILGVAQVT